MILRFLVTAAAMPVCAHFMEGVHGELEAAIMVGAILPAIYLVLRPLIKLITSVFNFCTLGLLHIALDTWLIWTVADVTGKGVTFDNIWWVVAVAISITVLRSGIDMLSGGKKK